MRTWSGWLTAPHPFSWEKRRRTPLAPALFFARGDLFRGRHFFRFFGLAFPEVGVEAVLGDEGGVRTAFDDAALIQHHDLVGVGDGAEAVGDDQRGAAAAGFFERVLHFGFCGAVE